LAQVWAHGHLKHWIKLLAAYQLEQKNV